MDGGSRFQEEMGFRGFREAGAKEIDHESIRCHGVDGGDDNSDIEYGHRARWSDAGGRRCINRIVQNRKSTLRTLRA